MKSLVSFRRWRRDMARHVPTVALLLALAFPASAQSARLHVLADSVFVGERFEVAVAVERAAGVQTVFPEPPGAATAESEPLEAGEAELLGLRRLPPEIRGDVRLDSAVYEAATFALDSARVGPVRLYLVAGGDTAEVAAPSAFVGVRSVVPADAEEPKGLAPLAEFPRAWGPWLVAALLVLALLGALAWWLRRRRGAPTDTATLPPHEELVVRLDRLSAARPDTPAAVKPFYVELSDALRTYLARSLAVPARELTTVELLAVLDGNEHVPPESRAALADVLRRADLVKFAEVVPETAAHETALARARQAVEPIEASLHPEPAEA